MVAPPALSLGRACVLLGSLAVVETILALEPGLGSAFRASWSGVGLAVVLVALSPVRRWPLALGAVLVVAVLARVVVGGDPDEALSRGAVETLEALVGALILTRVGRRAVRLVTRRDLLTMVGASLACGTIALVDAALRSPQGTLDLPVVHVGAQHAVSTLLLGSVVLLGGRLRRRPGTTGELVVQVASLVGAVAVVCTVDTPLAFVPVLLLVWAALSFDTGVVAAELLAFSLVATWVTAHGYDALDDSLDQDERGLLVLGFLAAVALICLPLALTVRHRAQLMARVSADEHLFRRTFTESPLGMVLLQLEDRLLLVEELNPAAAVSVDTPVETSAGRRLDELLAPLDPRDPGFGALLRGEVDSWRGHATALARPGSRLEVSIASLHWRDGTHIYSGQLLDVTQEHDAHRRLLAAHRLNDATLDTTACIILVTDDTGTVLRVNAAARDITGFGDDDLVGHSLWDLPLAPLSRVETEAMFVWPNRSGYPVVSERIGRTALGEPLRIVWNNNVVRDDRGNPSYAVFTGIDVTSERSTTGLISHMLSASIATALIGVDGNGRITLANAGAGHMLGWSVPDLKGRSFVELFDAEQLRTRTGAVGDHDAFLCLAGTIGDRDESPAREWTWRTKHGHELIVSMTLSVTEDLGAGRLGFLCVGRDVTAQREGQETLVAALDKERTAVERLRALDRAKDEFVSTVSHELRTPVTSIIGFTEMLRDGTVSDPSADQLPMLDRISRNSERLIAICNDLLVLSGFEAEQSLGPRTRVDLRTCVAQAYESFVDPTAAGEVAVHVEPSPEPLEVSGDRGQLDRVVTNLLGNALKFTPAGGRVDVSLAHDGASAVLTVSDTGIGIEEAEHDAVFQRFYRTAQAQDQAIPGTGLGLPIVAAIVNAHGGTITLESAPGRGTTFRVSLPLIEQATGATRPAISSRG